MYIFQCRFTSTTSEAQNNWDHIKAWTSEIPKVYQLRHIDDMLVNMDRGEIQRNYCKDGDRLLLSPFKATISDNYREDFTFLATTSRMVENMGQGRYIRVTDNAGNEGLLLLYDSFDIVKAIEDSPHPILLGLYGFKVISNEHNS
jgi:hypothetical protein